MHSERATSPATNDYSLEQPGKSLSTAPSNSLPTVVGRDQDIALVQNFAGSRAFVDSERVLAALDEVGAPRSGSPDPSGRVQRETHVERARILH
jgi:hypothetical protein